MYQLAKKIFADEDWVSPGKLQMYLQIPYFYSIYILDRMITEGFCEEQIGARPCRVNKFIN